MGPPEPAQVLHHELAVLSSPMALPPLIPLSLLIQSWSDSTEAQPWRDCGDPAGSSHIEMTEQHSKEMKWYSQSPQPVTPQTRPEREPPL